MAEYKITNRVRDKVDRVYYVNRGLAFYDELVAGTDGKLYDNSTIGIVSIDWFNRKLYDDNTQGIVSIDWNDRKTYDILNNESIDWFNRYLVTSNGYNIFDWENGNFIGGAATLAISLFGRSLYDEGGSVISIDWKNRLLYGADTTLSLDWENRELKNSSGTTVLDWENRELTNRWYINGANNEALILDNKAVGSTERFSLFVGNGGGGYVNDENYILNSNTNLNILFVGGKKAIFNSNGLVYDADYSSDYTNRSLVDKEYVDNLITGGGTVYTGTNGIVVSGSTIGLPLSGVTPSSYNFITVNDKGIITSATNKDYITNQTVTLSGDVTGSGSSGITTTLATVNSNVGSFNYVTVNGKGLATSAINKPYLTGNQTITVTGDVAGSGSTGLALTLPNINANVGTFNSVTVNAKGQVTAASNVASSSAITQGTNGLYHSGRTVGLGGTLTRNTSILLGGKDMKIMRGAVNSVDFGNSRLYSSAGILKQDYNKNIIYYNDGSTAANLDLGRLYGKGVFNGTRIRFDSVFETYDTTNIRSSNLSSRFLTDSSNILSLNWSSRFLRNSSNITKYDWEKNITYYNDGRTSGNYDIGQLYYRSDSSGFNDNHISLDYNKGQLRDFNNQVSVDYNLYKLRLQGQEVMDWGSGYLKDFSNVISVWYSVRQLKNSTGVTTLNYQTRNLIDINSVNGLNWDNRRLNSTSGFANLWWNDSTKVLVKDADFQIATLGKGLRIKEGTNAKQGVATLGAGGTVVVSNTSVTANSRIFLTCNSPSGTPGFLRVSARTASTSFTILSSNTADRSVVAWLINEPSA